MGDLVGVAVDPLGTLASSIAGFLLDRFSWFQEALDVLVGDPAVVTAVGLTWANIGAVLTMQAERPIALRNRTVQYWHGPAADAFRRRMTEMAERASAEAFACRCINTGYAIGSGIVTFVREIVSAICAELVGKIIVWVGEMIASLGLGTPVIVAQATSAIARWVDDAAKWTDELLQSSGRFCDVLQKLYRAFDDVGLYNMGIGPDTVIAAGAQGVDQGAQTVGG
ncbi:MAG: hypothetical protein QM630_03620 [Microbacterium sp.]